MEPVEPRPKKNCAVCGKPRKLTSPKGTQIPNHAVLLKKDPFCSSTCCKSFYAVAFKSETNEIAA